MGRTLTRAFSCALPALLILVVPARLDAIMLTFDTPVGATNPVDGKPVSARATFTTLADEIHITLENLLVNPQSVSQCISSLAFSISTGQMAGSLISSSAEQINIDDKVNPYSSIGVHDTGWAFDTSGAVLPGNRLRVLGGPPALGPTRTIIGPAGPGNIYSNANGSIAGNGPHNPFNLEIATFVLSVPGVTPSSSIGGVIIQFGTGDGMGDVLVPEPASAMLLSLGMAGFVARARRRRV